MHQPPQLNKVKEAIQNRLDDASCLLLEYVKNSSTDEKLISEITLLNTEFTALENIYNNEEKVKAKEFLFDEMKIISNQLDKENIPEVSKNDLLKIQNNWLTNRKNRECVFSCRNVCKTYPKSGFTLKNINIDLKEGEVTGVIGENGNGKTTLLKIIAGELNPDSGTVSYGSIQPDPNSLQWQHVKPKIGYLSQELGALTGEVRKSIQYAASLHGIRAAENDKEVDYIIQRLGLNKYKNAKWQELSGGYKLRFALAKILVWKPRLLVLDEPLSNLDINTQVKVLNDIKDLSKSLKNPMAVIFSSQNIEEVESASDNMIVLSDGIITFNNPTVKAGEGRKDNLFEFKTHLDWDYLLQKLRYLKYSDIDFNGFSYFIKTPLQTTPAHFLQYCIQHQIELSYFQNTGLSTKSLIIHTNLQHVHA